MEATEPAVEETPAEATLPESAPEESKIASASAPVKMNMANTINKDQMIDKVDPVPFNMQVNIRCRP